MPSQTEIQVLAEQKLAARERARTDKLFLATEVLGYDFVADVHSELFDQFIPYDSKRPWAEQSAIRKRLILWPRGHFKTTAVVVEIIQAILNFPDVRILIMQGSLRTTKNLLHEIASHFLGDARNSRLSELFPEFCGSKKSIELTAYSFTTPARQRKQLQQATVTCASPKATKTGQHYDIGFFDDLVNDQNYRSAPLLQKVKEDFNMCLPLLDPPHYAVVTGTRYAHGDLYEVIIRSQSEMTEQDKEWLISVKDCWTDDGKGVRFPQRTTRDSRIIGFTREGLLAIQATDPGMFAGQYLNRPVSSASQLFTDEKLMAAVVTEKDAPPLSQAILFCDLAATTEYYSDDSVIIAAKVDSLNRVYIVDSTGGQWTTAQFALHVIDMALKHRPLRIMFEGTQSALYFIEYLRLVARDKNVFLPIDTVKVDTSADAKNIRVCACEGYLRNKRLFFFANLPGWDKIVEQFKRFPKGKSGHDDWADTVAIAARHFAGELAPITPLSQQSLASFLDAIEAQGADVSPLVRNPEPPTNTMGDWFTCD